MTGTISYNHDIVFLYRQIFFQMYSLLNSICCSLLAWNNENNYSCLHLQIHLKLYLTLKTIQFVSVVNNTRYVLAAYRTFWYKKIIHLVCPLAYRHQGMSSRFLPFCWHRCIANRDWVLDHRFVTP